MNCGYGSVQYSILFQVKEKMLCNDAIATRLRRPLLVFVLNMLVMNAVRGKSCCH
jgi:hypothetical protein